MTDEITEEVPQEDPKEILEKLKAENERNEQLLLDIETARAKAAIGGRSEGAIPKKPELPKDEQVKEDIKKMFGVNSPYK